MGGGIAVGGALSLFITGTNLWNRNFSWSGKFYICQEKVRRKSQNFRILWLWQPWLGFCWYTAILRKVVGKSARNNPERYCRWFWVHCSSKKFERMAREVMDVCLQVLKESNKGRFDSYNVRNSVLIISQITFRDCRVHIFFRQPFLKQLYTIHLISQEGVF